MAKQLTTQSDGTTLQWRPTTNEPSNYDSLLKRPSFSGHENINEFFDNLEEYFILNKIDEADKYNLLRFSLKDDAKIWCNTIAIPALGQNITYNDLISKLKANFFSAIDKAEYRTEFFSKTMTFSEKPSTFLLRKLELEKLLDLKLPFAAFMEITTPLFTTHIQDFLDIKQCTNLDNLFQVLVSYEKRHPPAVNYRGQDNHNRDSRTGRTNFPPPRYFQRDNQYQRYNNGQYFNERRNYSSRNNQLNSISDFHVGGQQSQIINSNPSVKVRNVTAYPVNLPKMHIILNDIVINSLWDTGAEKCFISWSTYKKYFGYKPLQPSNISITSAQGQPCDIKGQLKLNIKVNSFKTVYLFYVIDYLQVPCIIGADFMKENNVELNFSNNTLVVNGKSNIGHQRVVPPLSIKRESKALNVNESNFQSSKKHKFNNQYKSRKVNLRNSVNNYNEISKNPPSLSSQSNKIFVNRDNEYFCSKHPLSQRKLVECNLNTSIVQRKYSHQKVFQATPSTDHRSQHHQRLRPRQQSFFEDRHYQQRQRASTFHSTDTDDQESTRLRQTFMSNFGLDSNKISSTWFKKRHPPHLQFNGIDWTLAQSVWKTAKHSKA